MKNIISIFLWLTIIALISTIFVNGQANAGFTASGLTPGSPSGSYQNGFDNINYFNGNLSFSLPLLEARGRGEVSVPISLNIDRSWSVYTYDSNPYPNSEDWVSYPVAETFSFVPKYNPGFMKGTQIGEQPTNCPTSESTLAWAYASTVTRLTFTSSNGTQTQFIDANFNGKPISGWNVCHPSTVGVSRGRTFFSTDGSGSTFVLDANLMENAIASIHPEMNGYLLLANGIKYRIDRGYVSWIVDRHGNKTTFTYEGDYDVKLLKTITDSLGRVVTFYYDVNDSVPYGLCDKIVFDGFGGSTKTIRISKRSLDQVLRSDQSLKTDGQLFGFTGSYGSSYSANIPVASAVWLPNGQSYQFKYNSYAELARVELPTGSVFEYDYASGEESEATGGYFDSYYFGHIYRRVTVKRTYRENGVLDGTLNVDRLPVNGAISVSTVSNTGSLLNKVKHFYYGAPDFTAAYYNPTGYEAWNTGIEYQTEFYGTDGSTLIQRDLNEYVNKTLPWSGNQTSPFAKDRRPSKQISITLENGQSLAVLKKTDYDDSGSSDPNDFSHLNVKKSKAYNYKVLDLSTAQNASIETISALFSESDLASLKETDYIYEPGYRARYIRGLPSETRILNPANQSEVLAKSQVVFDEQGLYYSMSDYGTTVGYEVPTGIYAYLRGNATTHRAWFADENRWIETHTQYDNFGNVRKVWDSSGDQNRFVETEYSSQHYYAYPTKTIAKAPDPTGTYGTNQNSEVSTVYDFWTGRATSVTDANGQITTMEYDALARPKKLIPPAGGGIVERDYGDTSSNLFVKTKTQVNAQNWAETTTYFDSLGRVYKMQTKDLQGDIFSEVKYDSFGRVEKVSNPYRQGEQKYWSKLRYDNAGRVVETYAPAPDGQTGASLGIIDFGISNLPGLIGNYVTATDASGRKARSFTNVYGQTVRVDEPTGNNDLGSLENPNQASYFTYNIKGEMVKIQQGNQNQTCATAQCRFFKYDSLGRLIRVRQPEQIPHASLATTGNPENNQWTSGFTYDDFGNVLTVTDAKGMTITNAYDKAGRVTTSSYSDGITPQTQYFYDGTGLGLSQAPQYSKGSLTKINNGVSETRFTSFDNYGRVLANQQITDGQTYNFEYKYDSVGNLMEEKYPSGRVVKTHLDADGGLAAVSSKHANGAYKNYASNFSYTATGNVKAMMLGNGRWETAVFNERLQTTQIGLGNNASDTSLWKVNYDYGELNGDGSVDTAKNIGMVAKQTITLPTTAFVQTYKYDALNRLTEAKENANTTSGTENWKQTFGYDRYGNRTDFYQKVGNNVLVIDNKTKPQIDPLTNRFTTGQGYTYDFNGNLIQSADNRQFTYDGDDKQTVVRDLNIPTTPQTPDANVIGKYYYDGEGKRVKKVTNSETTIFIYDAGGALVAEYSTAAPSPVPTTSYLTTDNLGSPRVITDKNGAVIARRDFMPFGEELTAGVGARDTDNLKYSASGIDNIRQRFTGYEKDIESDLDFAEARMYQNRHGRFTAPDPLLSSASLSNPQTFNRYIYTGNNPVNLTDPSGLNWCRNTNTGATDYVEDRKTCENGFKQVDNQQVTLTRGSIEVVGGGRANPGDEVILNGNGTVTLHSTNVSATEETIATPSATVSNGISSRPTTTVPGMTANDYLPPIPSPDPDDNLGKNMFELMSIAPGPLGTAGDISLIVISIMEEDYESTPIYTIGIIPFADVLKWGNKTRKLSKFGPTHNDLRYLGARDSHHIIQDAAVKGIPGYSRGAAPTTLLPGGGRGTPHYIANQIQKQRGGGTYGAERRIGYKALRKAGLTESQARYEIGRADKYFKSLGVTNSTVLPRPKGRRR